MLWLSSSQVHAEFHVHALKLLAFVQLYGLTINQILVVDVLGCARLRIVNTLRAVNLFIFLSTPRLLAAHLLVRRPRRQELLVEARRHALLHLGGLVILVVRGGAIYAFGVWRRNGEEVGIVLTLILLLINL